MNPYRTPRTPPDAELPKAGEADFGLHWMILAVGLVPFVGLAVRGQGSQGELGLATILVLFAGRQLARGYIHRVRAWSARRRRLQGEHTDE